ncbi:hypothetical protein TNCV_4805471 [Trichonephila clavipes]|nr:hypothetical protein TNCV_4805471 [Trichonephila clavipes]
MPSPVQSNCDAHDTIANGSTVLSVNGRHTTGYLVASGIESRHSGLKSDALTTRLPTALKITLIYVIPKTTTLPYDKNMKEGKVPAQVSYLSLDHSSKFSNNHHVRRKKHTDNAIESVKSQTPQVGVVWKFREWIAYLGIATGSPPMVHVQLQS